MGATRVSYRKFRNRKTNGYDSGKEANRAAELDALAKAGIISGLLKHPEFTLIPKQEGERAVKYIADFSYTDERGNFVVEDVKSPITRKLPAYILKRKLMLFLNGIRVVEL